MNYENKHRIESLAKAACPNNKKVSVIFRSKENKLSDRPNAFIVTVGKKGYTSVRQSNWIEIIPIFLVKNFFNWTFFLTFTLHLTTKHYGKVYRKVQELQLESSSKVGQGQDR